MRKHTTGLLALAATAALTLAGCGGAEVGGGAGATDDATGGSATGSAESIKIGIKFDQPGLGFLDGDTHTGFDVDVATYVAEKLGYSADQIEYVAKIMSTWPVWSTCSRWADGDSTHSIWSAE